MGKDGHIGTLRVCAYGDGARKFFNRCADGDCKAIAGTATGWLGACEMLGRVGIGRGVNDVEGLAWDVLANDSSKPMAGKVNRINLDAPE